MIKTIVNKLIQTFKTKDPFELCDCLDVNIIYNDLGEEVRGIYQYKNRIKIIHINNMLEKEVQKEVCCHELGHSVLHRKLNCIFLGSSTFISKNKFEIEANIFASELLISDEDITNYFGTGYTINQVANELKVKESLVEYKVKNSTEIAI